jgi:hypothetical protein
MDNRPYNRAGRGQEVLPPSPQAPTAAFDEWGTPYDAYGNSLAQPSSLGVNALTALAAPVNIGLGLLGALSPYDGTEGGDGWRVPPMISEPAAAFQRSGELTGFGEDGRFYLPNMQNEQSRNDALMQLMTVTGGNAFGAALRPKPAPSALAKAAPEVSALDAAMEGFRRAVDNDLGDRSPFWNNPIPQQDLRLYHGTGATFDRFNTPDVWATPNPDMASQWANHMSVDGGAPNVIPLEIKNARITRPKSQTADADAERARALVEGYDVIDWGNFDGANYYQAVRPGTVRSATTGETLFSDNKPSLLGSALASGQGEARFPTQLPDNVRLERSPNGSNYHLYSGEDMIGGSYVRDLGDNIQIGNISLAPEWQRQGIGGALHGIAEQDFGKPAVPDVSLSDAALDFWRKYDPNAVENYALTPWGQWSPKR